MSTDLDLGHNLEAIVLYFLLLLSSSGCVKPSEKNAPQIFLSCYWIFTLTIVAIFTGNLMASMTVQKQKILINSLEELVQHSEYQAGTIRGGATYGLFKVQGQILPFEFLTKFDKFELSF